MRGGRRGFGGLKGVKAASSAEVDESIHCYTLPNIVSEVSCMASEVSL